MALEGGIGIVHRAMSVERQAEMVRRVKRSHSAVIESPLRLPRGVSIREAKAFARRHHITAILIEETPGSGALAGLLTNRDIPRRSGLDDRPVDEFMTPFERLHVSPPGIGEDEAERLMFEKRIERLPLVDEARRIRGLITLRDILFFRNRPFSSKDGKGRLLVGAAIGARGDFLERARSAGRGRGRTSWSSTSPTPTRRSWRRPSPRCARASSRRRFSAETSRPYEGAEVPRRLRRRRHQGRRGTGPRLPDPARDRRRGSAAPGDP